MRKFKGGKFVLDYCNNKGDDFIKAIKEFETPIELDLGDGVTKLRKYDIEMQVVYQICGCRCK